MIGGLTCASIGADWSGAEQQLAHKIAAAAGSGSISLAFENRSSLGTRDREIIQNGLKSAIENAGFRVNDQAATAVKISLSENLTSYVWVAEVRTTEGVTVVMVSMPRPASAGTAHESVPLTLRRIPLWNQTSPMLDLVVLEETTAPIRIAVLEPERVVLYRLQGGKWQQEQAMEMSHDRAWPRDLRGRLVQGKDHLLDAYLPGFACHSNATPPFSLVCREGDDPWPLMLPATGTKLTSNADPASDVAAGVVPTHAFFAPLGNFFTGALTPGGKFATVPKFYSAALIPKEKISMWLFAGLDRQVHHYDGATDRALKLNWGSDLTSVKTACGAGWQILATSPSDGGTDSMRAYEVPDRDPVAVSSVVEFSGAVSALWTEAKGDTAVAIQKNLETGEYEAFRLAVACSQ
jgi:hypothetical protein